MTSIVKDTPSDIIFESLNRMNEAKLNGVLTPDELSKIITLAGRIFSNLVSRGLTTEAEVEAFETLIPNGKYSCFNYPHKELDVAHRTVEQDNAAAIYNGEKRFKITR